MPSITIRNLPVETHRALKVRAARHGRSTEAEIRDILEKAAKPAARRFLNTAPPAEVGRGLAPTSATDSGENSCSRW